MLIFKGLNEGNFGTMDEKPVLDFLNDQDIILYEIYNWLSNNQSNSNSVFLFGYFNFFGIETSKDYEKAFNLFVCASKQNHILVQFYVERCYKGGYGDTADKKLAFEYYEKVANKGFTAGQISLGFCYGNGIGVEKNLKMTIYLYEKVANNKNSIAQNNLASIYENGKGVDKDMDKAIYWYEKSTK